MPFGIVPTKDKVSFAPSFPVGISATLELEHRLVTTAVAANEAEAAAEATRLAVAQFYTAYSSAEVDALIRAARADAGSQIAALKIELVDNLGDAFLQTVLPRIKAEIVNQVGAALDARYDARFEDLNEQIAKLKQSAMRKEA